MVASRIASLAALCFIVIHPAPLSAQMVAFARDETVVVASLAEPTAPPKKLAPGVDPCISPDGKSVAFTQMDDQGGRRIAVVDVDSGKVRRVSGIPGGNSFMPIWSSDSKTLLFNHFMETDWALARVDAGGGSFVVILDPAGRKAGSFAPIHGDSRWLCHDMEALFTVQWDAAGKVDIKDLPRPTGTPASFSMPSRISVSADGKSALFDMDAEGEADPNEEGPLSAVYLLDIATGKITRLTPKGFFSHQPAWLPDGKHFIFCGFNKKDAASAIYRASIDAAGKPELLWPTAISPTVAKQ